MTTSPHGGAASRALVYASVAAAVAALALLLWYALPYLLLVFFGALLALLVRAPALWLARKTGMRPGLALALVALALLAVLAGGGYFLGHAIASQSLELGERLPQAIAALLERLREQPWGRRLIEFFSNGKQVDTQQVVAGGLKFASSAFEVVSGLAIVLFFAAFLSAQPSVYLEGALHLVPKAGRARAREVLEAIGEVLQRWLAGQAVMMLVIGVLSFVGLTLLGAPLALPLALIAGLLNFIPYAGPILSAIPAILVGFSESGQLALYIALLFVALQSVEGYLLEPLVQNKAVFLPPALILLAQIIAGVVAGPLGLAVATPLAAALMVAVKMLYVEDALGDRTLAQGSG